MNELPTNFAIQRRCIAVALLSCLTMASGCPGKKTATRTLAAPLATSQADHNIAFADVTKGTGVAVRYVSGHDAGHHTLLEWLGGGVALVDFDQDGELDLFYAGGGSFEGQTILGHPPMLYRNTGPWKYSNATQSARCNLAGVYSHGCEVADLDNDGFPDILVTGYGGLRLFHNMGDGTYEESSQRAGLTDDQWSTGAGWGDLDGDGNLDLYVVHYVNWSFANHPKCTFTDEGIRDACPPQQFDAIDDLVYFSNGDGTFRDSTSVSGLIPGGKGLGVVLADLDQDSDLDIYVANDTTDNFLYLNNGQGEFTETGLTNGVAGDNLGAPNGSMGVDVGDYDRDGQLDLWVTNFFGEPFALYHNLGKAYFQHESRPAGVNALGGPYIGFGTGFADLDLDGDEDLAMLNGHIQAYPHTAPVKQLPLILRNDGGKFKLLGFADGDYFATPRIGRGLAFGDLDRDGDLDMAVTHMKEPAKLLRNDTKVSGQSIQLRLIGQISNRDAIGSVATLHTTSGDMVRTLKGGGSYFSHHDLRLSWGVPVGVEPTGLSIVWPDGQKEVIKSIGLGTLITSVQP